MIRFTVFFCVSLSLLFTFCVSKPLATSRKRILFVGNSYTYFQRKKNGVIHVLNDIPKLVEFLAANRGEFVEIHQVTHGGYSLKKHFQVGRVSKKLKAQHWDIVVLQERTRNLLRNPAECLKHTKKLISGTSIGRLLIFQNWPKKGAKKDFESMRAYYRNLAVLIGGEIVPIGERWQRVGERFPLYSRDNSHPSALGAFLTALTIDSQIQRKETPPVNDEIEEFLEGLAQSQSLFGTLRVPMNWDRKTLVALENEPLP